MYIDFSNLFHRSSKDHTGGGTVRIPKDVASWPKGWTTTEYKSYGRLPKVSLPDAPPTMALDKAIQLRSSNRHFSGRAVDTGTLAAILRYSCGLVGGGRRAQPSAGARYPIEMYLLVFVGSEEIPAGVYHYDVRNHALDVLVRRTFAHADIAKLFFDEWAQKASCAFVLTASFDRTQRKYGERGYRYVLLEAGHISQNIYLNVAASGLSCCAIGGAADDKLEGVLGIDGVTESIVHAVMLG